MGLDFSGYLLRKGENLREIFDTESWESLQKRELFYGRKSWELVYALRCDTQHDCISKLELEDWVDLMEILGQIGDYFKDVQDAYKVIGEDDWETYDELESRFPREVQLIKAYQKWYDMNFDIQPTLGYEFSVGYMKNFWEVADKVISYLENPDYEVWMSASY